MIVDVHCHTPTHRDEVPDDERLVYENWRTDRPVTTTNSWADFDAAMAAADVSIVFNIGHEAIPFYARAEKLGLPILFHQGTSPIRQAPLRYTYPLVMDEIALRFPELRIVMAHLGHPFVKETVAVIRKHPHVYADVSSIYLRPWLEYEALITAVEWGSVGKLLLGSDYPIANTGEALAGLRRVNDILDGTRLPRVPETAIEQIIQADALTALGLTLGGRGVAK